MGQKKLKIGTFLIQNDIINETQLNEALELQKDNPDRRLGEVLVTMGIINQEELIMALEMFMIVSEECTGCIDEWLVQEEIDMLMEKMETQK